MKVFIGILVTFVVITGAILTILALWGIQPISWTIVWKSGITILIAFGALLLAYLCYIVFFKNYRR
ncbi:MAG: hypothetical protein LBF62_13550 [Tannerellaceae bacterium]|jgi:hypothetical protein|nr:hypothetical protein [Tannerellaceae bacterium]